MKKYEKIDTSVYLKAKWAMIGLNMATELGRLFSIHKVNLLLTLQLSERQVWSSNL